MKYTRIVSVVALAIIASTCMNAQPIISNNTRHIIERPFAGEVLYQGGAVGIPTKAIIGSKPAVIKLWSSQNNEWYTITSVVGNGDEFLWHIPNNVLPGRYRIRIKTSDGSNITGFTSGLFIVAQSTNMIEKQSQAGPRKDGDFKAHDMEVYPSLCRNAISIKSDINMSKLEIISAGNGRIIAKMITGCKHVTFNVAGIPPGPYLAVAEYVNGERTSKLFIKQ